MTKYAILSLLVLLLSGCNQFSSAENSIVDANATITSDTVSNDAYISSIDDDTTVNTSVAKVPHTKSSIPMLGILVSYNDIQIISSEATWSSKLFGTNAHQLNHYFSEVSNSNFKLSKAAESDGVINNGIVSITLNKKHPDTNIDYSSFSTNAYPDLKNALVAVDNQVDFSNYDSDGNGNITPDELLLTFIIAGYEDSYEGKHVPKGIWAHQYCMTDNINIPILDGVSLMGCVNGGNFALFGELHDITKPHDATIGIIAHELGHSAFSLPDLYNTSGNYGGIGYFGLMGAGTWTAQDISEFPGNTPSHLSAWSKVYNGWATPVELSNTTAALYATSSSSYNIIKIPISANHYYLLENRGNSGYDRGLYYLDGVFNGGVAIWHINENKLTTTFFENNSVNANTYDKGVDLVEASHLTIDSGGSGHEKALFYDSNVNYFGTKITDISSRSSAMTLNIN